MFDKLLVVGGRSTQHHYHRSEVHEHRAPTDESVKLLREMEQAALDKIMATVRLEGCEVDCFVAQQRVEMVDEYQFFIRYKLGTRTQDLRVRYRHKIHFSAQEAREDAMIELRDALAKDIANGLLADPMRTMMMGGKFPLFP
jgi:hypothetical protein